MKTNISVSKQNMDKLKNFSSSNKMKNISSLIGSIQKIRLDDPNLNSRCTKVKRVEKQSTVSSGLHTHRSNANYTSNTSQDLEYNKTTGVMKKNKSNCSQNFEKITSSDKQLKKDSSTYSRASNASKKYYSTMNSNSERGHKVSTQKLRKDIEELKMKHKRNVNKVKTTTPGKSVNPADKNSQKRKHIEGPARIQAKLICKLSRFKFQHSVE